MVVAMAVLVAMVVKLNKRPNPKLIVILSKRPNAKLIGQIQS